MPDAFSRRSQFRARASVCLPEGDYGPLVVEKTLVLNNGEEVEVGFQNPLAFLNYHCKHSPHYARLVEETLKKKPSSLSSPWTIILYLDRVDPGDGLQKHRSRPLSTYDSSFKEFGAEVLAHEQVWGTVTCMRTSKSNKNLKVVERN